MTDDCAFMCNKLAITIQLIYEFLQNELVIIT